MKSYYIITSIINIAILTGVIIAYHRHNKKELAKHIKRIERKRGKYFDLTER